MNLSDHLADQRRATIPDVLSRNLFFQDSLSITHTTLAVSDTVTLHAEELLRIRSVQVGATSGGTVTVQIQVDGRDIFDDAVRPLSGGGVQEPTNLYTFQTGSIITSIIEATSGAPTDPVGVIIELEPYYLAPKLATVVPTGGDRLSPGKRERAELLNTTGGTVRSTTTTARERSIGKLLETNKIYQRATAPQIGEPPPEDFRPPRFPRRR